MTYIYDFSTHCAIDRLVPCVYNQNAALLFSRPISPLKIILAFSLSCSNEKTGVSSRGEVHITANNLGAACSGWGPRIRTGPLASFRRVAHTTSDTQRCGSPARRCANQKKSVRHTWTRGRGKKVPHIMWPSQGKTVFSLEKSKDTSHKYMWDD